MLPSRLFSTWLSIIQTVRAAQGAGAATIMPLALALMNGAVDSTDSVRALRLPDPFRRPGRPGRLTALPTGRGEPGGSVGRARPPSPARRAAARAARAARRAGRA